MTHSTRILAAIVILLPTAAYAQGMPYICVPSSPGSEVMTCVPAPPCTGPVITDPAPAVAPAPVAAAPAPVAPAPVAPAVTPRDVEQTLEGRTHVFIAPTGEMLRKGEVAITNHEILWNQLSVGVTDNLELSVGAPVVPVVTNVGARAGVKAGPVRLVASGNLWVPVEDIEDVLYTLSITGALQGERLNVHATLGVGAEIDTNHHPLAFASAGVLAKIGKRTALFGELAYGAEETTYYSYDCYDCGGSYTDEALALGLGVKYMGERFDIDGGFVAVEDGLLPAISMTFHR